jgi:hypothetical protein
MCNPAVSVHLTWRLLDDLCGIDRFTVCLSVRSGTLQEECNTNWVMKQADWALLSQLAKIKDTFSSQ